MNPSGTIALGDNVMMESGIAEIAAGMGRLLFVEELQELEYQLSHEGWLALLTGSIWLLEVCAFCCFDERFDK
jgi:hypothetical protein